MVYHRHILNISLGFTYRILRKFQLLDVTRLLLMNKSNPSRTTHLPDYDIKMLDREEVRKFSEDSESHLDPLLAKRLTSSRNFCAAAISSEGNLAAYVWFALEYIEPEQNRGGWMDSGVAISFPRDIAFCYNVFTLPRHRGLGISGLLKRFALQELSSLGIHRLLSTTDVLNSSAKRSFEKLGYQEIGFLWKISGPRIRFVVSPREAKKLGINTATSLDRLNLSVAPVPHHSVTMDLSVTSHLKESSPSIISSERVKVR